MCIRMQIMNATEASQQFHISVTGMPGLQVVSENDIEIASTQARWVAVRVLGQDGRGCAGLTHHPLRDYRAGATLAG
jgi:hypothetical protein